MFNYYWLISRGKWWIEEFQVGWDRLKKCGIAVGSTAAIRLELKRECWLDIDFGDCYSYSERKRNLCDKIRK
tara:strand:- start:37 stop:252 length:216 start_codon:yes stop_codon:yes gene_type:complete